MIMLRVSGLGWVEGGGERGVVGGGKREVWSSS